MKRTIYLASTILRSPLKEKVKEFLLKQDYTQSVQDSSPTNEELNFLNYANVVMNNLHDDNSRGILIYEEGVNLFFHCSIPSYIIPVVHGKSYPVLTGREKKDVNLLILNGRDISDSDALFAVQRFMTGVYGWNVPNTRD